MLKLTLGENIFPPVSKESRRFLNPLNLEKERERVCASSGPALQDPFSYPQHTAVLAGRRGLTEAFQSVENMSDRSRREVLMQQGPKRNVKDVPGSWTLRIFLSENRTCHLKECRR